MHMPTVGGPSGVGTASGVRVVEYTATGSEGTSFTVPIGTTLDDTDYSVMCASQGVGNIPFVDLPTAGRTTSAFPVVLAAPLTAGEVLHFWITEV